MSGIRQYYSGQVGRRDYHRLPAVLPAIIRVGGLKFVARLANIATGGAMLDTTVPVLAGAKIIVCCGTVAAEATVIWRSPDRIGVSFDEPLSHKELQEQVARSTALRQ